MGRFVIDALWIGEAVRQALVFAMDMRWINLTESQEANLLRLVSFLVTGFVGMRTVSARVLDNAGTSVEQVKAIAANPNAQMVAIVDGRRQS